MTSDADGNTLTDTSGRSLTWDSQNRMVSCTKAGVISTYTYGADGLRRSSTVNGVTTYYVYDGQTMIREVKRNPQNALVPVVTYLQGPQGGECRIDDTQQTEGYYRFDANNQPLQDAQGQPLIFRRGVTKWYVYDGLGSVVGEVDASGSLTSSPKYDVYGATRGNVGTASSRQGFVGGLGHVSDTETGLVYMRARYYDPSNGRFVSQDPATNGANWFIYCSDEPVSHADPTGRDGELMGTIMSSDISATLDGIGSDFAVDLEGAVRGGAQDGSSGALRGDAQYWVQQLEQKVGIESRDDSWGYYTKSIADGSGNSLKAWVHYNEELQIYDMYLNADAGEAFAGHATPSAAEMLF